MQLLGLKLERSVAVFSEAGVNHDNFELELNKSLIPIQRKRQLVDDMNREQKGTFEQNRLNSLSSSGSRKKSVSTGVSELPGRKKKKGEEKRHKGGSHGLVAIQVRRKKPKLSVPVGRIPLGSQPLLLR